MTFLDQRYHRSHQWQFDGYGAPPWRRPRRPMWCPPALLGCRGGGPEEAYIAALASCHMLWFWTLPAARAGA